MHTQSIPYQDGSTLLEGFAAYSTNEKRPLIILCHAWKGRDPFICEKAKEMAEWGYVGFALDMYGQNVLDKIAAQNPHPFSSSFVLSLIAS